MLDKIWRIQKRAIHIICNVPSDTPTAELFKNLNFLNIYERYFYQTCVCTFTILDSHKSPLKNLVTLHNPLFYNLRSYRHNSLCINVPFPRLEIYKSSLSYACANMWNSLPINIRSSQNLISFKTCCKQFIRSSSFNYNS